LTLTLAALTIAMLMSAAGYGASSPGGEALYARDCEGCHGPLGETSIVKGATAGMIQFAIGKNFGGMGRLSHLGMADRHMIANALSAPALQASQGMMFSSGPSASSNGAPLYDANCASCHGPLSGSSKSGATDARIQSAIAGNTGGMGYLSALSATDVQAIASALDPNAASDLAGLPPVMVVPAKTASLPADPSTPGHESMPAPKSGQALYESMCMGCHGQLSASTKVGATLGRIQSAINGNAGGMGYLNTLSATDLQLIASALGGGLTPYPTGTSSPLTTVSFPMSGGSAGTNSASLYDSKCASCHGGLSGSSKAGATVSRIQNAISGNTGGMGYLSMLSATDLQAIASELGGGGATAPIQTAANPSTGSTTPSPRKAVTTLSTGSPASPTLAAASGAGGNGAAIYGSSCASCHGPLAGSSKTGATAARIQSAISSNAGGMGSLASMPPADLQAVAAALGGNGGSPTLAPAAPAGMTGNCASCHPNGVPKGQMGGGGITGGATGGSSGAGGGGGNVGSGGNENDNEGGNSDDNGDHEGGGND